MRKADEALRAALTRPAEKRTRALLLGLTAAALFLAMLCTRALPADAAAGGGRVLLCLFLTAAFAFPLAEGLRGDRKESAAQTLLLAAAAACGLLLRLVFLMRPSPDYENYLSGWLSQFAAMRFPEAMRGQVTEYNVLYQYLLFLAARLPVSPLAAVKAISVMGDFALAAGVMRLSGEKGKTAACAAALLLPCFALNGGQFAQCDSLYSAAAVWGLAFALDGRPKRSAACFALSLAFKLQAVFLFPVLPVLWAGKRLRLSDAPVFAGTLLAAALPALLAGKTPGAIVACYAGQTGLYTGLTYNAPTFFGLLNTAGLDVYAYGRFGILLAAGACLFLTARGMRGAERADGTALARLAACTALAAVFFLPRMHERYFYLAEALLLALSARDRRYAPALLAAETACLSRLWDLGIGLRAASLLMLAALAWTALLPPRGTGGAEEAEEEGGGV